MLNLSLCACVLAGSLAGGVLAAPGVASADTPDMCVFQVAEPRLEVGPGGSQVVSATFTVESCPGTWQPTRSSVCVAPPGGGGSCTSVYGWGPDTVTTPATATGIYEATGQGCARVNVEVERCVAVARARTAVVPNS